MSEMHAAATRTSPSIEEKRFPLLIPIQYFVEIAAQGDRKVNISAGLRSRSLLYAPMREEKPSSQERVRLYTRQPLKSLKHRLVYPSSSELYYELIIVDRGLLPVARHRALNVPGCNDLFMSIGHERRFDWFTACGCRGLDLTEQ